MNKKYVSVVPQESDPSTKCKSLSPLFPDGWGYAIGERWIHEYFGEKYAIGTEGYKNILKKTCWEYAIGKEGYMIILKKNMLGICQWGKWAKYPGPTIVGKISKPDNIIANLWNEQFF